MELDYDSIGTLVRKAETDFTQGGGTLTSKYVSQDLYEDINKIEAYLNSKHISGETDALGREKPFFNIGVAARNVWYRATDIDRKHIQIKPSKKAQVAQAFIATTLLQNWMRRENFGAFLNDWGLELATYNSSILKFVESNGRLHPMVASWNRMIVDIIDFKNNPKIEILELTEAQLYQREGYDKNIVAELCNALKARTLTDGQQADNKSGYIKLYEVHGKFPLSYITDKEKDKDTYVQQMHVVSYVATKKKGKYDDYTLYRGREKKDPYMLTSLLPNADGSISLNGSVKLLFEAQWMMNHTVKSIKDQLDVASKLIFQTSDSNFIGRNVLSAIESGDILTHKANEPLTQVNNSSHDVSSQTSFGNMWKSLSSEIAGVSESMLGNAAPSGTAWRQVEALLQESHSLFNQMTENKGLHIEEMLREYVIPYVKKQMDTSGEITAILEAHDIHRIDAMYVPKEAILRHKKEGIKQLLKGEVPPVYDPATQEANVKNELNALGNRRFFVPSETDSTTWAESLKDLEWEVEVEITGEDTDSQMVFTTLNTALATVSNPNYQNNEQAQLIVSKLLSATGVVSPVELSSLNSQPQPAPTASPALAPASPAPPEVSVSGGLPS